MNVTVRAFYWFAALMLVMSCHGCGPSVYQVKGKITFEGKPMQGGGAIAFVPLGDQRGKNAGGEIAPDGTYTLTTNRPGDGSLAGEFRVVIMQATVKEPAASTDGGPATQATGAVPDEARISEVYADHGASPLKAKVEAKSMNEINFDLQRITVQKKRHLD